MNWFDPVGILKASLDPSGILGNLDSMVTVQTEAEAVESVKGFHQQLRRLILAKIPICLELGAGLASEPDMESISKRFETHIEHLGTIESYLADENMPTAYRAALKEWLQGARQESLNRLTSGAEGQRFFKNAVGFVLLQASLLFAFLFAGMVGVCWWLLPRMESIQSESFTEPGFGLTALVALARTMPYWSSLILGLSVVSFIFRRTISERVLAGIAPMREESFALSEFQSLYSRPARFQWMVSCVVVVCGFFVLLQALSVLGVTFELLTQLVAT